MAIDVAEHAIVKQPVDPQHHKANGVGEQQMQIARDGFLHFFACGASREGWEFDLCGNDRDSDADDSVAEEEDASNIIAARRDVQATSIPAPVNQRCYQGEESNQTDEREHYCDEQDEHQSRVEEQTHGHIGDETWVHLRIQQAMATAGVYPGEQESQVGAEHRAQEEVKS